MYHLNRIMFRRYCRNIKSVKVDDKLLIRPIYESTIASLVDERCGVHVLCSPSGTNKGYNVHLACSDLFNSGKLDGVGLVQGVDIYPRPTYTDGLMKKMGVIKSMNFVDLIPEGDRYGIVIENFDCFALYNHPEYETFVVSLAEESVRSKKFSVLLTMQDYGLANKILRWNNGEKIRSALFF